FTEEIQTGDYIGLVETRPIVQNQEMNDVIVRVPVGETVIIGGISSETSSDSRSTPWSIWDIARSGKDSTRTQLFIIIRPLVTLYEVEGNEILLADKFAPKTQRHASVTPGMMMLSTVDVPIDPVDAALAEPVDAALVEPDTDVPVPFFKGLIQGLTNLKDVGDFDVGPWESR
ncbi:MAG: hypothetical protein U9N14_02330, partial [Pseudomonadota bacterium]|nr:hypothetical protein [Pseudomonadota bacterium]